MNKLTNKQKVPVFHFTTSCARFGTRSWLGSSLQQALKMIGNSKKVKLSLEAFHLVILVENTWEALEKLELNSTTKTKGRAVSFREAEGLFMSSKHIGMLGIL